MCIEYGEDVKNRKKKKASIFWREVYWLSNSLNLGVSLLVGD